VLNLETLDLTGRFQVSPLLPKNRGTGCDEPGFDAGHYAQVCGVNARQDRFFVKIVSRTSKKIAAVLIYCRRDALSARARIRLILSSPAVFTLPFLAMAIECCPNAK
jgi:hypothetical protein